MRGKERVTFIRFENLYEGSMPVSFNIISKILGIKRMPRRGRYVNKGQAEELIRVLR
ncbi:MAG: hypothetical protein AOA65_0832 [Candidatus Bathyarchaeota archaeon BA1]|nr:MAG: hypothetical protein AOA65_0832 [Candidatus Bathyarchaeota archaeon BA1]